MSKVTILRRRRLLMLLLVGGAFTWGFIVLFIPHVTVFVSSDFRLIFNAMVRVNDGDISRLCERIDNGDFDREDVVNALRDGFRSSNPMAFVTAGDIYVSAESLWTFTDDIVSEQDWSALYRRSSPRDGAIVVAMFHSKSEVARTMRTTLQLEYPWRGEEPP